MNKGKEKLYYFDVAKRLEIYLELARKPVGIKFLFTEEEYNAFDSTTKDTAMTYCTMVRNGALGESFKAKKINFACHTGGKALGVMEIFKADVSGQRHADKGVYKDIFVSKNVHEDMVYCKHEAYGVGIKPLEDYDVDPDVVIIVTNAYGIMRLVQGKAYHLGQTKNIKMTGMNAICQECTSYPYETDDINISALCSGSRHVCQWGKDELAMGIPISKLSYIVDGVVRTSNPMDRNEDKERIEKQLDGEGDIRYNQNYYTGAFKSFKCNKDIFGSK